MIMPSNRSLFEIGFTIAITFANFTTSTMADEAAAKLQANDRIVFLGDSITQAGDQPDGYVDLVRKTIAEQHGDLNIEVIGAGISGNKVPDLEARLDDDVLGKKPTRVVIYIGINDVWHSQNGNGTPKDVFEAGLNRLIDRIQATGAKVMLCTPSMIGEKTDGSNELDPMLEEYAAISRQVAAEKKTELLDLRKKFVAYLEKNNPEQRDRGVLTTDGVHLNPAGNRFVAKQMLAALGAKPMHKGLLRHVVLFKFKKDTTPEQLREIENAYIALPEKIPAIHDFEWGTDISVENLHQGFTHCFLVTFTSEEDRATYLPHPEHRKFVDLITPHFEKVFVIDYWAREQ